MPSRRTLASLIALFLAIVLSLTVVTTQAVAQEKEDRLEGRILMIDKDKSAITLRVGNASRTVVYNSDTKFTVLNKPGSLDDLKEHERVICLGDFDEKGRLVASRIDARRN